MLKLDEAEVSRIEQVLRLMHLLQPRPGDPNVLVPVSPDVAAADLVGPAEHQIRDLRQAVTDVRSKLLSLSPLYFEGRRLRNRFEAFDVVTDVDAIQNMLDHLGQTCRKEVLTVQPGGARPSTLLPAARKSAEGMLERGVRMHTIYQHTARSDLPTKAYVRDVTAMGAEIRTADQVIDRMLIYDRETVFLPVRTADEEESTGAAIVREPTLVAFLCAVFEHLWDSATPFVYDTPTTDDLKQSIIRLMARGYKDEMVARRLGMSVRTCRRHISEITEELEATSRFQAGYNVAMAGLLGKGPAGAEPPPKPPA
ncbi:MULTISPECIES: LuxR C-terminal-related transcriptional regulator [unclassified Kitasatospora]|uniref:LuxR C-terminal-related transcriptional regulator n=1 Tax=unclassified Kitasatospora TaxID=2633591 RepID=UPI002E2ECAB2|nr:LuxR C-terminal-related transcriptional regulator [Kitasatospora sp. NBC_01246]